MTAPDNRCKFTWVNKHKEKRRCMLDAPHPYDHRHGIESHPQKEGMN